MDNYIETKKRMFENQKRHEYVILNYDNEITRTIGEELKSSKPIFFSFNQVLDEGVYVKDGHIYIHDYKNEAPIKVLATDQLFILGDHNIENALAATAIAYYTGVSLNSIRKGLKEFRGVEHRIEFVKEINGIKFYNDSKGTNPEASIKAIQAMKNPTVLIAGGMDKGSDFQTFVKSFDSTIKVLILFGETADLIEKTAKNNGFNHVIKVQDLSEAVTTAVEQAHPNDNILLSPACASWDMYESFEHRGREFKALVYSLED
jgi:UDP-N-acetylmuramoylalanine--D-glutamate ligase